MVRVKCLESSGRKEIQWIWPPVEQEKTILWRRLLEMISTVRAAGDLADALGRPPGAHTHTLCYFDSSACPNIMQNMCTALNKALPLLWSLNRLLEAHKVALDVLAILAAVNVHEDRRSRT